MTSSKSNNNELNNSTFLNCASLDSDTPLEASAPLGYQVKPTVQAIATAKASPVAPDVANADMVKNSELQVEQDDINQPLNEPALVVEPMVEHGVDRQVSTYEQRQSGSAPTVVEEEKVRLLEERLVVDRKKRKVGEVIVRKVIETHIVEVPVRREKLLIEQVGAETRQLASIDLGQPTSDAVEFAQSSDSASQLAVGGKFKSIKAASQFLATIASGQPDLGCQDVQVRIVVDSLEQQQIYQQWLSRYLDSQRLTNPAT